MWFSTKAFRLLSSVQFSSVIQSCPTLCNPMHCSTPGFPVHHQLPELTQTHVHLVSDPIQPSHSLSSPSPTSNHSQHQSLFKWVSSLHQYWFLSEQYTNYSSDPIVDFTCRQRNKWLWRSLDTWFDRAEKEKGITEVEMVGWHHQLNEYEFE